MHNLWVGFILTQSTATVTATVIVVVKRYLIFSQYSYIMMMIITRSTYNNNDNIEYKLTADFKYFLAFFRRWRKCCLLSFFDVYLNLFHMCVDIVACSNVRPPVVLTLIRHRIRRRQRERLDACLYGSFVVAWFIAIPYLVSVLLLYSFV